MDENPIKSLAKVRRRWLQITIYLSAIIMHQQKRCLRCLLRKSGRLFRPTAKSSAASLFYPNSCQKCEFRFSVQDAKFRDFVHFPSKTTLFSPYFESVEYCIGPSGDCCDTAEPENCLEMSYWSWLSTGRNLVAYDYVFYSSSQFHPSFSLYLGLHCRKKEEADMPIRWNNRRDWTGPLSLFRPI